MILSDLESQDPRNPFLDELLYELIPFDEQRPNSAARR